MELTMQNVKEFIEQKLETIGGQISTIRAFSFLEENNLKNENSKKLGIKEKEFLELYISENFVIVSLNEKNRVLYRPLLSNSTNFMYFEDLQSAIIYGILIQNKTTEMYNAIEKLIK